MRRQGMDHVDAGSGRRLRRAALSLAAALLTGGAVTGAVLGIHRVASGPTAGGTPPSRSGAAMADDPATGDLVMFGGQGAAGLLDDTWLWNGSAWTEARPAHSPPPEHGAEMAWDPKSRRDILLGGMGGPGCRGPDFSQLASTCTWDPNAWAWDGTDWTKLSLGGVARHSLAGAEMATDPAQGAIVLLTSTAGPPSGVSSGSAIACPMIPASPPANSTPAACPPLPCRIVGSAGAPSSACPVCPPSSASASGSTAPGCWGCDGAAQVCVPQPTSLTWVFDGSAFEPAAAGPTNGGGPPLAGHLVWFPSIHRLADLAWSPRPEMGVPAQPEIPCFVGQPCPGLVASVWEWYGSRWTDHQLARGASGLPVVAAAAGDAAQGKAVALDSAGATWVSADPAAGWTTVSTPAGPGARSGVAMAFDSSSGEVVLFGGTVFGTARGGTAPADDTWTWDGSRWTHRGGAAPSPGPRLSPVPVPAANSAKAVSPPVA